MNKFYLPLLLLLLFSFPVIAQDEPVRQLSHDYFRPDPFETEFNKFIQRLFSDTSIHNKEISKRTDSSLFYFYGTYRRHDRFFFKPKRVDIVLEETVLEYSDSMHTRDTILVYQLVAFVNNDETGRQEVKKEYDKIHKKFSKSFSERNTRDILEDSVVIGGVHNYFLPWYRLSPVSVSWKELLVTNEIVLSISIRIKQIENQTGLPAFFYKPQ